MDVWTGATSLGEVKSYLKGGDVEVLPEGEAQDVEVLTAIAERAGQSDEDYEEDGGERLNACYKRDGK